MKAKYIYDINDTLVFLTDYIQDKMFSYDAEYEQWVENRITINR